jgi:hypothetical protein
MNAQPHTGLTGTNTGEAMDSKESTTGQLGKDKAQCLGACVHIRQVAEQEYSRSDRVADGSHSPPAPAERCVRIARTTLFRR